MAAAFTQLIPFLWLFLISGIAAGWIAGLMGIGGGIVLVPVLFHIYSFMHIAPEIHMHMALGTSLATIIITSARTAQTHYKHDAVDMDLLKSWAPLAIIGAFVGSQIAADIDGKDLTSLFAIFAAVMGVRMIRGKSRFEFKKLSRKNPFRYVLGMSVGMLPAMLGVGGGVLAVPVFVAMGYSIRRAVGTGSALVFCIALPAAIGFMISGWDVPGRPSFSIGFVHVISVVLICATTFFSAPMGARMAHKIETKWLRMIFGVFLLFTAVRMLWI